MRTLLVATFSRRDLWWFAPLLVGVLVGAGLVGAYWPEPTLSPRAKL